jgi:hypothetical protein
LSTAAVVALVLPHLQIAACRTLSFAWLGNRGSNSGSSAILHTHKAQLTSRHISSTLGARQHDLKLKFNGKILENFSRQYQLNPELVHCYQQQTKLNYGQQGRQQ